MLLLFSVNPNCHNFAFKHIYMNRLRYIFTLPVLLCFYNSIAQSLSSSNPLLVHTSERIKFNLVNAAAVREAVSSVIAVSDARVKKISSVAATAHTLTNTLMAFDELSYDITDLSMKLQLIASTYANDSTRNAANEQGERLAVYANGLFLNEKLYKAIKEYSTSASVKMLKPNQQKFLREAIIAFEKNGMKLKPEQRQQLLALNEKVIGYGIQFDRNLAEAKDSVAFTEDDLKGVAANTKQPWKRSNGYMVTVNGPNYNEIISNADSDSTRHTIFLHYNNRAYPKNLQVLDSLLYYRSRFAKLLGFKSYAEYALADKMAASPANVWRFEYDLVNKLTPHVTEEMNELRQLKHQLRPGSNDSLYDWDISYYRKKLLDTKYQVNADQVKEYFEMNNTLQGMFTVYQNLLNIQIKEVTNVPVWHPKVKAYEMYKEGKKIGNFYLDLFPRANKYTHFACFPISEYRIEKGKEVLPVSALICNFPEGDASQPSLLYHGDVITLFHEFGHLVHSMLGRSDLATQGPFAVKGDFTEAPSQFLENWVWQYESLKLFARHYKTGEVLPQSLFNKMKQTQMVGIAMQYIRQVYLGMLDFTYEDKYDSLQANHISIMDVSKSLSGMRQMPFSEGTHFIASFTHLNGYGANYYGYLWSKVYAEDMFSVFKKNGVMDTKTGIRYRQEILEKASTKDEMDMLRSFLGREPNSDAFLQSLGIKG